MASSSLSRRKHTRSATNVAQCMDDRGGFLTAHIIGQPYGEMSPKFIKDIIGELEPTITVFDSHLRTMTVQFNGSTQHPMIIGGWNRMREFFEIVGNKMLMITYVGQGRFLIEILLQEFNPNNLGSWHSYRTYHTDLTSFNVTLTPYHVKGSQLTLQKNFADYIRSSGYKELVLYGPEGDEYNCSILLREKSVKIGKGWKRFVHFNCFEESQVLNFKFVHKAQKNVMKVIALNEE